MSGAIDIGIKPLTGSFNRIFDSVQLQLPGVLLPVVQEALLGALQEFADRSTYFRTYAAWTMPPTVRNVDFNPVDGNTIATMVVQVKGLTAWTVQPPAMLIDTSYTDSVLQARGGYATLILRPVSLGNPQPSTIDLCYEALLAGTLERLYGQPMKPYSSEGKAAFNRERFDGQIKLMRAKAETLYSQQQNWQFPYFARGRRKR